MSKHIAHTINRSGEIVPGNGFKTPEKPEIMMHNPSPIWMHSIDRSDSADPVKGFLILIGTVILAGLVLIFVR